MRTMAQQPSSSRLILSIGLFVLVGFPLVAYLWESMNELCAGHVRPLQLLIAIPVAILLYLLLRFMARSIQSWDRAHSASTGHEMR